jgi:excisionase family DNA binding protein
MKPRNEANNKKRPSKTQNKKTKTRSKPTKNEARTESQEKQEEGPKEASKGRTQTATTQPPTDYAPSGSVPGPQFGDLKRQEGSEVMARATPAVPPAADCGTAPPCGGRLYGGPARGLTFGLLPNKWIKQSPFRHQGGMERNAPPITFFTERTLATYLAVSDRTIRNWIRRGELPSYKLGASRRIDPADVDAFLAQRRDEPA